MLLAYSIPTPSAAALSGSAGSAWLTADGAAACYDGKPARKARLRWASAGAPAITDYVQVDLTIASTSLRVCTILGLTNVPAGAVVRVYGKRPADGSVSWDFGGQNEATVLQFPDGTFGAWFILPEGATAVTKVGFRFYNNVAGATWATAATSIDIGELVAGPALELPIADGWAFGTTDPTAVQRSRASQVSAAQRSAYRVLSANVVPLSVAQTRGGGLDNGMDLEALVAALRGAARCCAIPHYRDIATKAIDMDMANRTAIYGIATTRPDPANVQRGYFRSSLVVEEVPA